MAKKVVGEAIKENRSAIVFMKNLGQLTDQEASYLEHEFTNLGIEPREVENIMRIAKGEIEESQEYIPGLKEKQENKVTLEKKVEPEKVSPESIAETKGTVEQETKPKEPLDSSTLGEEEIEAIEQCIEAGLIGNLAKVPEDKRKKMIKAINNSLEERTKTNPTLETSEVEKTEELNTEEMPKIPEDKQEGYEIGD